MTRTLSQDKQLTEEGRRELYRHAREAKGIQRLKYPRAPLYVRPLPDYSKGEEVFNMVTHIVGGALGVVSLGLILFRSIVHQNWWGLFAGLVYALSMILCYTISSVYHGLGLNPEKEMGRKVLQVLDHCDIYFLIAGSYTPIALGTLRETYPVLAWTTFGIVWFFCILGTVFTAIDFHKYGPLSYACYFVAGWSVLVAVYAIWKVYSMAFVLFLLLGGIAYTSGMVFFVRQTKGHKYNHSVFHLFILAGSVLQFIGIYLYCI